jgi:hypothetical protein
MKNIKVVMGLITAVVTAIALVLIDRKETEKKMQAEIDIFGSYLSGETQIENLLGAISASEKVKSYALTNFAYAQMAGAKYKINPLVILAQGAIESAWGTSHIAKNHNNYFGVTAYGSTNEYWKGEKYVSKTSGLPFRSYKKPLDSFYDYARLISVKYTQAARNSFDVERYAKEIAYSPYISEKNGDNRPVYYKLIIQQADAINKVLAENNLMSASKQGAFGIFGFAVLMLFGWMGYEYFFTEKDEKNPT